MSQQSSTFVLIILKPTAAKDIKLSNFIKNELAKYGEIKHLRQSINVDKQKISQHYQFSRTSPWYPFIVNYFSGKTVQCFILEAFPNQNYFCNDSKQCDFGKFLKTQVIGSADICKTKKHHIRRLARKKPTFLIDNLIHSSDNTQEALAEIRIWYKNEARVIAEFEAKALVLKHI
jgi:nucleoside diphosphate kinase